MLTLLVSVGMSNELLFWMPQCMFSEGCIKSLSLWSDVQHFLLIFIDFI